MANLAPRLKIPAALIATTIASALACSDGSKGPIDGAADDASIADAGADGCIYQLCNGSTMSPSCPGVVCLPPTEECPSGCETFV